VAVIKKGERPRHPGARVDILSSGDGFLLTLGPVSLVLDRETAEEVMCLLADALEPNEPFDLAQSGSN
jgi:hypothetical protein